MNTRDKPVFYQTKAERKRMGTIPDIEAAFARYYRELKNSRFSWSGKTALGIEERIEDAISGGTAIGFSGGSLHKATVRSVEDLKPLMWSPVDGTETYNALDAPLILGDRHETVPVYVLARSKVMNALIKTATACAPLCIIKGAPGTDLRRAQLEDVIDEEPEYLYNVSNVGVPIEIVKASVSAADLGMYTQVLNELDTDILTTMGIPNAGQTKNSGVTAEETQAYEAEVRLILQRDYERRVKFCDQVNSHGGQLRVSCRIPLGYQEGGE